MSVVLQARNLAFGYAARRVGEGVDLALRAGEVLCLLGPNGCGKTTLFRTLLGLLPALAGEVRLDGEPLARFPRTERARRIAYVPQAHAGAFAYRVDDVVLMGRAARIGRFAAPSAEDRRLAAEALQRLGIGHLAARRITEVSGGERQLALIARALAQQAPLLVMDEPTASLDFGNQVRVLGHVGRLRAQGMAVCLSTHQPEHAWRVADRVALMRHGRLLAVGPPAEVMTAAALAALYDVDEADVVQGLGGLGHLAAAAAPP